MRLFLAIAPFCLCAVAVLAPGLLAQDAPLGMPAPSTAPNSPVPGAHDSRKYPPLPGTKRPKSKKDEDLIKISGEVRELAADHLVVETKEHRVFTFHLTKDTKFLDGDTAVALKDITLGQLLDVDAQEDDEEEYYAVTARLRAPFTTVVTAAQPDPDEDARPKLKFGKPATTAVAEEAPDADADARPTLRPGKPAPRPPETETADTTPATDREEAPPVPAEPKPDPHAEFLEKSRELAFTFTDGLPNYSCIELVTRYFSDTHAGTLWKPQDVVSEEVVWNNNHEDYRNVQIDGKKVDPAKMGDRSWSTGEFGTVLLSLLHPATDARFTYVRTATMHHTTTMMYDFAIDQPHSHWTIQEGGQSYRPAYSGTIWFDKASGNVLRLEYSADDLPKEFPADTAETTLDYDYVQLGQKRFLLPVHSEVLICHRGMSACSKNAIEFRNYHKFGAESDIKFATDEQNAPPLAPSAQPKPKH